MAAPKRKGGLGRGLSSLFEDVPVRAEEYQQTETEGAERREKGDIAGEIVFLDINDIRPNANQPRKDFNEEKIEELANSIEIHGVIQPIMVRPVTRGYEIVAGERRWRAARKAGLKKIPAIVRELDEQQNMLIAIIENMQREDLNPIEEALALEEMIRTYGLTQEEVSRSVGKSRPYITNALRLLKLPEEVRVMVSSGTLSGGHARAIAGLSGEEEKIAAAKKAVELGWSVREIENYAGASHKKKSAGKRAVPRKVREDVLAVEAQMKDVLGTKVKIQYGGRKGKIEIEYYSRDELDRLVELILGLKQ